MNQDHYIDLIAQYLAGEISEQDQSQLMEWVASDVQNQALLDETTRLWKVTENYNSTFDTNVEAAWNRVESRIDSEILENDSSAKIVHLSNFKRILQIAAVILLAAMAWIWFSQESEPQQFAYQTLDEKTLEIKLPDGSQVVLNENSNLTYQEKDGKRMVTLKGEAWFDVKKDTNRPFIVKASRINISVLGTKFNVSAYKNETIDVVLESGKVKLKKENSDKLK